MVQMSQNKKNSLNTQIEQSVGKEINASFSGKKPKSEQVKQATEKKKGASSSKKVEEVLGKEIKASFPRKKQKSEQIEQATEKKNSASLSEKVEGVLGKEFKASSSKEQLEVEKEEVLRKELRGYGLDIDEVEALIEYHRCGKDFFIVLDENNKVKDFDTHILSKDHILWQLAEEKGMSVIFIRNDDKSPYLYEITVDDGFVECDRIQTIYDQIYNSEPDVKEDLEKWAKDKYKRLEIECEKLEDEIKEIKSDLDSHENEDLMYVTKKKKLLYNDEKLLHEKSMEVYRLKDRGERLAKVAKCLITMAQEKTDGSQEEMIKYIKGLKEIYKDEGGILQEGFDLAIDTINERVRKENLYNELPQLFKDFADTYGFEDIKVPEDVIYGGGQYHSICIKTIKQNKTDFAYGRGTNTLIAKDAYLVAKALGSKKQIKEWSELDQKKRHEMVPGVETDTFKSSLTLITDLAINYLEQEREKMRAQRREERKEDFVKMMHRVTDFFKSRENK